MKRKKMRSTDFFFYFFFLIENICKVQLNMKNKLKFSQNGFFFVCIVCLSVNLARREKKEGIANKKKKLFFFHSFRHLLRYQRIRSEKKCFAFVLFTSFVLFTELRKKLWPLFFCPGFFFFCFRLYI